MKNDVFKKPSGSRLEAWYHRFLDRVPVPAAERRVPTSLGSNNILIAGEESKPVLISLHAMMTSSAHLMAELGPLTERYRIIAPDIPGQSVRGLEERLPLNDNSYAEWLLEVLEGLKINKVNLLGVSWGGFIALQFASAFPEKVNRLVLLVPAGIVRGAVWKGLLKMAGLMIMYRFRPSEQRLRNVLEPIMTTWDADWAGYFGDLMCKFGRDMRIPPLATDEQLRNLKMPTLVIGAAEDISFPGVKLVNRVQSLIPQAETELIENCKHCPPSTDAFRSWMADRVTRFLEPESEHIAPHTG